LPNQRFRFFTLISIALFIGRYSPLSFLV